MYGARCQRCLPRGALPALTTWLLCQFANKPRTLCGDPVVDAQALVYLNDYLRRVAINGGAALSQTSQDAIHVFLCTLIQNAIDTQIVSMCCFTPESIFSAITPVINVSGNDPWTPHRVGIAPPLTLADIDTGFEINNNGLHNLGTIQNGWIDTGVNFGTIGGMQNSAAIAAQVVQKTATDGRTTGVIQAAPAGSSELIHEFTNVRFFRSWSGAANGQITEAITDQETCFLCGTRRAANDFSFYQGLGGVFRVIQNKATTDGTVPSRVHFLYGFNNVGGISDVIDARISFVGYFKGLTEAQVRTLYTAVNVMRVSMGGGTI